MNIQRTQRPPKQTQVSKPSSDPAPRSEPGLKDSVSFRDRAVDTLAGPAIMAGIGLVGGLMTRGMTGETFALKGVLGTAAFLGVGVPTGAAGVALATGQTSNFGPEVGGCLAGMALSAAAGLAVSSGHFVAGAGIFAAGATAMYLSTGGSPS